VRPGSSGLSRRCLVLSLLAFAVAVAWLLLADVDRVPGRLGADGEVERWDSVAGFAGAMTVTTCLLAAVFGGARWLLPHLPASAINLPSRAAHAHWTDEAHRPEFDEIVASGLEYAGAAILTVPTVLVVTSGLIATGVTVPAAVPVVLIAVAVAACLAGVARIIVRTRRP